MTDGTHSIFGHDIDVSSTDKVFFADAGISKGDLIDHYAAVGELILDHGRDRPLAMVRLPDGLDGQRFFQKNTPEHYPAWIRREQVPKREGGTLDHVVLDDPATPAYLAQQGAVELHPWLSAWPDLDHPVEAIFDLDPPADADVSLVRAATRRLWELFDELGVTARLKTSGSKGFHLHLPLDGSAGFDEVRAVCADVAGLLADRHPDLATTEHRRAQRDGRVFIDHLRNAYGQTAVAPYSVRARPGAPVAVPLDRDELSGAAPDGWSLDATRRRLAQKADPWTEGGAPVDLEALAQAVSDAER